MSRTRYEHEQGFSLVEIVVAVAVIVVGVLALLAALSASTAASASSEDTRLAIQALRAAVAEAQACPFDDFWDRYNPTDGTERLVAIPGTAVAADGVTVAGLRDGTIAVAMLTEAETEAALGAGEGTINLDGDGVLGETEAPAEGWRAYGLRVTVEFGERRTTARRSLDTVTIVVDPGR